MPARGREFGISDIRYDSYDVARKQRLEWIGLALIALYAAVVAGTIAWVGADRLREPDGFAQFWHVALAASPVAVAALVLTRLARGRAMTAVLAAACSLLVLARMARGEASGAGIGFAVAFLVVLLIVELVVGRAERGRRGESYSHDDEDSV